MTDTPNSPPAEDEVELALDVGATLRAAREAQGLTTQEIAERIKFSSRQIEALERNDTEHLPQGTFLRGFIRSYARVLHLDPEPLLNAVQSQPTRHLELADVQEKGVSPPIATRMQHKSWYWLVGTLLITIVLVFLYSHFSSEPPGRMQKQSAIAESSSEDVVADAVTENAKESNVAPLPIKPAADNTPIAGLAVAKPESETTSVRPEIPLEQLRKRPIHFVFLDEVWVEVKDVNQKVLLSRVFKAGMEKWSGGAGREPYQITIGKAGAVQLYYKGKEVDLSGYKPGSVARVVLE